ncbi:hypothetical protein FJO69_02040 [[Mycoplasma] falconis]|uniref:Uncharacterized protein n=1 Tax=[Mycoplasma] falconis TaxID=92403 RepID=A0A501X9L3_9BACT|nr:hypothetical protein [[Mycoplasma] falconis]TPE57268.1 hypothetical protein FJO69_02040 [[Mycoplasma] falconis]
MKLKIKKVISTMLLAPSLLIPTALIAAESNNENNKEEKEKTVDKDFENFNDKENQLIEKSIEKYVDFAINELKNKVEKLLDNASLDVLKENLVKIVYYKKLIKYLSSNKAEIIKKPNEYGLEIVFPYVLSQNKNYKNGEIIFEDETYTNIIIGDTEKSNYQSQITGENNQIKTDKESTINTIDWKSLEETTQTYFDELEKKFESVFIDEDDLPQIGKNTKVISPEESLSIDLAVPDGYENWNAYLKTKINKRFINFDLEQNQNFNQQNQEEQEKEQPEIPPIIPQEEIINDPLIDFARENVARLSPYVSYEYFGLHNDNLIGDHIEDSSKYFWFKNPIVTRYEYKVLNILKTDEGYKANVMLVDKNHPTSRTTYITDLKRFENRQISKANELAYKIIQQSFDRFYQALGINDDLYFKNLRSQKLASTVFNMIEGALTVLHNDYFVNALNDFISKQANLLNDNLTIEDELIKKENKEFINEVNGLFLTSLRVLKINGNAYWLYLGNSYQFVFNQLKDYIRSIKENIENNFKNANKNINNYLKAIEVLQEDIIYLKNVGIGSTYSVLKQYNTIIELITKIQNQFINISTLSQEENIDFDNPTKNSDNWLKAYQNLYQSSYFQPDASKKIMISLGAITLLISIIFLIITVILSKLKNVKNNKGKLILSSTILAVAILATVVLLVVGIGVL